MKIATKLYSSFSIVALLCAVVGGVGFFGLMRTANDLSQLAEVELQAVEHALRIKDGLNTIKAADRNLLIPTFTQQRVLRQYGLIEQAWKDIDYSWSVYDGLEKDPREAELWNEIKQHWPALRQGLDQIGRAHV